MDDLVQWLRAQLDADVEQARAAAGGDSGEWFVGDKWNVYRVEDKTPDDDVETNQLVVYGNDTASSDYIAEHDPSQRLREIDSKRRQVEWCVEVIGDRDLSRYDEVGSLKDDRDALAVTLAVESLRLIALPYDARPGYLAEWAPSE